MLKKDNCDILIAGGGAAGLTLAIILAGTGLNTHLIDPFKPRPFKKTPVTSRTTALMNSSLNILKSTGVWPVVEALSAPLQTMRIIDDSIANLEPVVSDFEAPTIGEEQYGFNIPGDPLRAALYEIAAKEKNIKLHVPAKLDSYEASGSKVTACLEDGKTIEARLLIGADGKNSAVRALSGIETKRKDYNQSAVTCLINHSQSHGNLAHEFHRPGGPLALVPLPGNQCSVVWVKETAEAERLASLNAGEFTDALQKETRNVLGGITLEDTPASWPLSSLRAKSLTAPRMALIAEAAHAMSPITAQGLNLSLRDVAALAEEITDTLRLGLDIGSGAVLAKYESRRALDIKSRVAGVDGMNTIVSTEISGLKQIRRAGLMAVDKIAPLKSFAMRQGLAPPVDEGRLARGEAL